MIDLSDYDIICANCNKRRGEHTSQQNYTWCVNEYNEKTNQKFKSSGSTKPKVRTVKQKLLLLLGVQQ